MGLCSIHSRHQHCLFQLFAGFNILSVGSGLAMCVGQDVGARWAGQAFGPIFYGRGIGSGFAASSRHLAANVPTSRFSESLAQQISFISYGTSSSYLHFSRDGMGLRVISLGRLNTPD